MYRMQVYDRTPRACTGISTRRRSFFPRVPAGGNEDGGRRGIGTDPAVTYAATAPLPRGIDESCWRFIRGRPVMVKAVTVDLEVRRRRSHVEGYVDPPERREGPFGDHTGYYSLADEYPVFTSLPSPTENTRLQHDAGRSSSHGGLLPGEGDGTDIPAAPPDHVPEITDYWLPWEGVFHNVAVVAIENAYPARHAG